MRTPVLRSHTLDERLAATVLVKPECLQRTGTFKFRGAFNRLVQLDEARRRAGVVAFSSGNHAQGVAAAAHLLGIPATIVMPEDAPAIKIDNTRRWGAELVLYDRRTGSREEIGARLAAERGATLVPSFDDVHIIAGQGTVGLELVQQAETLGVELDQVLICCGGGGLTAGSALAIHELSPATKIYTVEPAGFDDTRRSLERDERVGIEGNPESVCDALLTPMPGELTFAINRRLVDRGLVVSDEEAARAVAFAFRELKVVLEPSGAVSLAALLSSKLDARGQTIGVIASGGNVDSERFAECLARHRED